MGLRSHRLHRPRANIRGIGGVCVRAQAAPAKRRSVRRSLLRRESQRTAHDLFPQRLRGTVGLLIFPLAVSRGSRTCRHCRSSPRIVVADASLILRAICRSLAFERARWRHGDVFRHASVRIRGPDAQLLDAIAPLRGRIGARFRAGQLFVHGHQ